MANKTELKQNPKEKTSKKMQPGVSQSNQKGKKEVPSDKDAKKTSSKKSSALTATTMGRSAIDHMKPDSGGDVRGSNGITNTGPFVSYDDK